MYAEMVHSRREGVLNNTSIVIYTDAESFPLLTQAFSAYPKIIFAVVNFPKYALGNRLEPSIMRCMRYQALESFPRSWICVRDADTLFTSELRNAHEAYVNGWKGTKPESIPLPPIIPDYRPFFVEKISAWEEDFITQWMKEGSSITLGTAFNYIAVWHTEFPFIYPIKRYIKAATKELSGGTFDYVYHVGPNGSRTNIDRELGGRFRNAKNIKFFSTPPKGIYAGFTNFTVRRPQNIWLLCYDYLVRHYEMMVDDSGKRYPIKTNAKTVISDKHVEFADTIGKDERMLLFAILPHYYNDCYFFSIEYYGGLQRFNAIQQIFQTTSLEFQEFMKFPTIPIEDIKPTFTRNTKVTIYTILLRPDYVTHIYSRPERYNNELKKIFSEYYAQYNEWLADLMGIPEARITEALEAVIGSTRQTDHTDDYVGLNKAENFATPPRRIEASTIGKNEGRARSNASANLNAALNFNSEGGYRYTRYRKNKNKKKVRATRRALR
jgi:hypothetical protein